MILLDNIKKLEFPMGQVFLSTRIQNLA